MGFEKMRFGGLDTESTVPIIQELNKVLALSAYFTHTFQPTPGVLFYLDSSKERLYRALLADTHDLHTNGYYGSSVWGCGTTDVAMPSVNRLAKSIRPMYPIIWTSPLENKGHGESPMADWMKASMDAASGLLILIFLGE
ncbi:uncharacterized protein LAJ45_05092 [Morchella importuna]|uniref:uncharacterized protein n=1 Tax=Morchella importuna TaxID=1174673 RepID=UPI001E8E22E5|nr:uncharacterized protein LAJ45_05092 [Morchella importuna]KAH8150910.1 hypothetical protein LAJ45_05092 [Morchella importuna]